MDDEHKISPEVTLSDSTTDKPIESFTAANPNFWKSILLKMRKRL